MTNNSPLFESKSNEHPYILHVSFQSDPKASLGVQLINTDKGNNEEMFLPGYASVGRLLPGETVASKFGVKVGDIIIAVNGTGFRRYAPESNYEKEAMILSPKDIQVDLDNAVVPNGQGYQPLIAKIKEMKGMLGDPPLILTLERYGWNARANSWQRFLLARDNNVPDAMMLLQRHEIWRTQYFPIDLTQPGLQRILREKAVSEIDVEFLHRDDVPPTVYVNYGKLQSMQSSGGITADDVVQAFVIFTERMLSKAKDPRHPQTCQFIDLSGVSISSGLRVESLKKIYEVFEPNYPETLFKMVMYPVSSMVAMTATKLLSFVNERTKQKFLITNSLEKVCEQLGWNPAEVESCGGVTEFMHKHEKAGDSMIFS